MFSAENLLWVKNVKREGGAGWAYMEQKIGSPFYLHFPDNYRWYPTNYSKAKPGELILIFQTVNEGLGVAPGSYITHIVTPVDELVLIDRQSTHPYKRLVLLIAKAFPPVIKSGEWNFKRPNRGQICNIDTIKKMRGNDISKEEKQTIFWNLFTQINPELDSSIKYLSAESTDHDEEENIEGAERTTLRLHKYYERNPKAVAKAKAIAKRENRFFCESCTFNFAHTYPSLGDNFIECHHRLHMSTGIVRNTKPADLALVCANCHRMLHRKYNGSYLSVEELKHKFFQ